MKNFTWSNRGFAFRIFLLSLPRATSEIRHRRRHLTSLIVCDYLWYIYIYTCNKIKIEIDTLSRNILLKIMRRRRRRRRLTSIPLLPFFLSLFLSLLIRFHIFVVFIFFFIFFWSNLYKKKNEIWSDRDIQINSCCECVSGKKRKKRKKRKIYPPTRFRYIYVLCILCIYIYTRDVDDIYFYRVTRVYLDRSNLMYVSFYLFPGIICFIVLEQSKTLENFLKLVITFDLSMIRSFIFSILYTYSISSVLQKSTEDSTKWIKWNTSNGYGVAENFLGKPLQFIPIYKR